MPSKTKITKKLFTVTSLAVQWLRLHASVAGATGLILGQELRSRKLQDSPPPPGKKKAYTKQWITDKRIEHRRVLGLSVCYSLIPKDHVIHL